MRRNRSATWLASLLLLLTMGLAACQGQAGEEASEAESPAVEGSSTEGQDASEPDEPALDEESEAAGDAESDTSDGETASDVDTRDAIATVNGQAIALADFQRQAFDTQRYHVDQGGIDPNTEDGQRRLLFLRRQVLNDMIDQVLIEQAAEDMGVVVEADEVEDRMAEFIEELGGDEAFETSLEEAGTTREDVFEMERASLVGRRMLEEIATDVPSTAEFLRARHILCASAEACQQARLRIQSGEDFETVAEEVSEDETSRERGGDLDWVTRGMLLSSQLEEAIFGQQPGQLSEVVETDLGYHVIEVVDRDAERELPEAQRTQLKERALLEWLAEQREEADIQIFVEDLREEAG